MSNYISHDHEHDGIDRRGFLKCMAWAGTGVLWSLKGGIVQGISLSQMTGSGVALARQSDFSFVQISDSHIGFSKPANTDVTATLQQAINKINAFEHTPDFLIHTGDLS